MTETQEKRLIRQALEGNELAFRELIEAYYKTVERFARQIGVQENDLADVTQDVFIKVYRFLNKYSRGKFTTWLYSITLNVSKDLFKKQKRELEKHKKLTHEPLTESYLENHSLTEDERILHSTILQMEDKYRIPIVLFYFHDQSITEIAAITKTKEATIKTHLKRGKERLKNALKEGGFIYEG
ncbi:MULTISPECIES: RNA polymerase sigma factor [Allobacillus]|uniref:RNA polymerase sigma factor n=1 Tax=Allobacillus salarius TaxID=1955272 RepID=A0A556PKY9_9BACI|nr:RNA polymerase sigma factor [Allobacillus salarius]TSJ65060.1 RNA polymerase sigma factor [Allobacillus salarius]